MPEWHVPWWLVMAGTPSFLYAICNKLDEYQVRQIFQGELVVPTLLCISGVLSGIALPFLWWYSPTSVLPEHGYHYAILALAGLLHFALLWFYLTAMTLEDSTTIIIFYALLPVMGLIFSGFFLGESLSTMQLIAMATVIVGILFVSFERDAEGRVRAKWKAALLMTLASLCWALGDVAFKAVALEENVWRSLFWEHIFLVIFGIATYFVVPGIRAEVTNALAKNSRKIIVINVSSEVLYIIANVVSAFPLVMVQVAAVHLVQAFQPVWVFLLGLLAWWYGLEQRRYGAGQLLQRVVATAIAVYGMWLLAVHTPA